MDKKTADGNGHNQTDESEEDDDADDMVGGKENKTLSPPLLPLYRARWEIVTLDCPL